jgi:hypothetical protein
MGGLSAKDLLNRGLVLGVRLGVEKPDTQRLNFVVFSK